MTIVKRKENKIVVKTYPKDESKTYRVTKIKVRKDTYYIKWTKKDNFMKQLNKLKRCESTHFKDSDITYFHTKTHRRQNKPFIAKGFIP